MIPRNHRDIGYCRLITHRDEKELDLFRRFTFVKCFVIALSLTAIFAGSASGMMSGDSELEGGQSLAKETSDGLGRGAAPIPHTESSEGDRSEAENNSISELFVTREKVSSTQRPGHKDDFSIDDFADLEQQRLHAREQRNRLKAMRDRNQQSWYVREAELQQEELKLLAEKERLEAEQELAEAERELARLRIEAENAVRARVREAAQEAARESCQVVIDETRNALTVIETAVRNGEASIGRLAEVNRQKLAEEGEQYRLQVAAEGQAGVDRVRLESEAATRRLREAALRVSRAKTRAAQEKAGKK